MLATIIRKTILVSSAFACVMIASPISAKDQYYFQFQPQVGQKVSWNKGVAFADSTVPGIVVRVTDSREELPDGQTTFRITILNAGDVSVEIIPEDIWIEDAQGERIAMLTYEELEGRHRRDIKRRSVLAIIGGAFSAAGANGYTTGSVDFSGTTMGGTSFNGSGSYSTFDPVLARQQGEVVAAQNEATLNAIRAIQSEGIEALKGMLRRATLEPGEVTTGIVAFDPPRALRKKAGKETVSIVVKVGASTHRFSVKLFEIP